MLCRPQDGPLSLSLLLCSKSSGSAALLALTWTCLLVRIVFPLKAKRQGDIWNKLVGSLVFGAVRVSCTQLYDV